MTPDDNPTERPLDPPKSKADGLAKLEAAIKHQDEKAERNRRRTAEQLADEVIRVWRAREEREMTRLAPARDSIAAQIELLAKRLRKVLGEDYGIAGDWVQAGFVADTESGEQLVALEIGGRVFTFGAGDLLLVWRERHGELQFAVVGEDGEAIEPWRAGPEGWKLGLPE